MAKKIPFGFDLWRTLPGHGRDNQIAQVAWSPNGKLLASCADDAAIILWDVKTREQTRTLREHKRPVYSVAWSPDGAVLASGSDDCTVRLWDPGTGRPRRTLEGHKESVIALAWSPDGKLLASGGYDGTIQLWNMATGRKGSTLGEGSGGIYGLAWSPDGLTLAAACYNRDIQIWNVRTGKLKELPGIEGSSTFSLAWSPSLTGNLVAAGFWDGTIKLWDGRPDRGFPVYELHGHDAEVGALGFSHDGHLMVSKSRDDSVRLWHCHIRKGTRGEARGTRMARVLSVLREPTSDGWIGGIAFHPKKSSVLATLGLEDTVIRIWQIDVPALLGPEVGRPRPVSRVAARRPGPAARAPKAISVFVSYSHDDRGYLDVLQRYLAPLARRKGDGLKIWDDTMIAPGGLWKSEISAALESATVAVLLISQAFLASDFINTVELPNLLAQQRARGLKILPVLLKPSSFKRSELAQFQAFNNDLKSLLEMTPAEQAQLWVRLADFIEDLAAPGA